jgi:hypothetical protein
MKNDRKNKLIKMFLEECGWKDVEITAKIKHMFAKIEATDMNEPMILKDRKNGLTVGQLSIKYNLSQRQVKYILYG